MSKSAAAASASEGGLTLIEAFKRAIDTGRPIRRARWFATSMLDAFQRSLGDWCLIRSPEQRNWSGEFGPSLEDMEATDWEVV